MVIVARCGDGDGDGVGYGDGLGGAVGGNHTEGEAGMSVGGNRRMRSSHPTVVGGTTAVVRESNPKRANEGGDRGGSVEGCRMTMT